MHTRRLISLALGAAVVAACSASGQTSGNDGANPPIVRTAILSTSSHVTHTVGQPVDPVNANAAAAVTYRIVDSLANAFSYYTLGQQPLRYDPATGVLVTIMRGAPGSSNDIYIRTSTDMGANWSAPMGPLHDDATLGGGRYPSVVPLNPQGGSTPGDLYYYYCFPTVAGGAFGNYVWGVVDATGSPLAPAVNDPGVAPETWETSALSVVSATNDVLVTAGTMSNNNIGMRRLDVTSLTATTTIPPQWEGSHYSAPVGAGRTSTVTGLDRDANNVFYLGAYARFPEQEVARRVQPYPALSTSTDKGLTWSDFDVMSIQSLVDYVNAEGNGANPDSVFFPYAAEDFAMTTQGGNGIPHWALACIESDAAKDTTLDQFQHIVEVVRGPSGWSVKKIADYIGYFNLFTVDDTSNQVDNEIMLSTTADGSKLVCKWVDAISYIFSDDINGDLQAPDTMTTMDVFMSVRSAAGGTWSPKVNVTETPILDKVTWMADVAPNDLSKIPMLAVQTIYNSANGPTILDSIFHQQRISDIASYVVAFDADASAAADVKNGAIAHRAGMHLSAPNPNPVRDRALVTYTIPEAGQVTIKLYDLQGRERSTIRNERMEAGNWGFALNTADLPSGTYYYTLRLNGDALTKMFNVVR